MQNETTLKEYLDSRPAIYFENLKNGSVVVYTHSDPALYRLKDYVVSSALSGPSYVLVPRKS